jgi:hypothetical protein
MCSGTGRGADGRIIHISCNIADCAQRVTLNPSQVISVSRFISSSYAPPCPRAAFLGYQKPGSRNSTNPYKKIRASLFGLDDGHTRVLTEWSTNFRRCDDHTLRSSGANSVSSPS